MRAKISTQLILVVGLAALAVVGLLSSFLLRSQERTMLEQMVQQADQLSETIKSSTHYDMLHNQREDVHRIIDTIGRQAGIHMVRIFNKEGRIIYSPQKAAVGTMVDKRTEACFNCHAADQPLTRLSEQERTRIFVNGDGQRSLGIVNPIYNEPACWQADCHAHAESQSVLGVLDLTMLLAPMDNQLSDNRRRVALVAAGAVFLIGIIIWLLLDYLVGKPVGRLLDATRKVATGDFSHRVETGRNDELGQLGRSFNEMTQQLAETQFQLYQSNKLASVGRLAAGIAHEINNPMTGILSYSSLLLRQKNLTPEAREDLETIVREAKRCRGIVKGLLDFSRQAIPRKTIMDINEIVHRALDIVSHQLSVNNIHVSIALSDSLPAVRVDPNQMVQVLINLLVNAADAIGTGGGEAFVGTDLEETSDGRWVRIKVSDSGHGIAAEDLERIFEPFFTTKGVKGTGLGLAVVWGIIDEHDGNITINSQPQRGATFTIRIPVQEGAVVLPGEAKSAGAA